MAETVTRQLREPFVEAAGLGITNEGLRLLKDQIPTSTFTGRQFVAGESDLEQQARQAAGSLQAGPDAYQAYMSPYQREVIDTHLTLQLLYHHRMHQLELLFVLVKIYLFVVLYLMLLSLHQ